MTAKELFRRYARVFNDDKELMYMTESQFVAALAEAMEGGHLQPVFSQSGEAGSKGGPKDLGGESFWNERKEYINNDPMFHSYYCLYRNGVDLNELKDNMITHLLKTKKE